MQEAESSGLPPEEVVRVAAEAGAPEWTGTLASLGASLAVELETARPMPPDVVWVRNPDLHGGENKFHVQTVPAAGARLRELKTRCGWRFAKVPAVVMGASPPVATDFHLVCTRCVPKVFEALWAEFAASMKRP